MKEYKSGNSYNVLDKNIEDYVKDKFEEASFTILDLGAGQGKYGKMFKSYAKSIDAVEIFKQNINDNNLVDIYDNVYNLNLLNYDFNHYDLVIIGDVLEHVPVEDAQYYLNKIYDKCDEIIIIVPYEMPQIGFGGNEHEAHIQPDLTHNIFLNRYKGFKRKFAYTNLLGVYVKGEVSKKRNEPVIHMLGMPQSICNDDYDHCAFTTKVRTFPSVVQRKGWNVIEYSNGDSLSEASEHVQILTKEELEDIVGKPDSLQKLHAQTGSPIWATFYEKLVPALLNRVQDGDIIAHPYGRMFKDIKDMLPNCFHVETGVGYLEEEFGTNRIYESYSWMHYNHGIYRHRNTDGSCVFEDNGLQKIGRWGHAYEWVIPNAFDTEKWIPSYEKEGYLLFVGRIVASKGIQVLKEISEHLQEKIVIAGMGETELFQGEYMDFIGSVTGHENKNNLFKNARAVIMPTQYNEPLGFVAIEAMLSGTPVITTDWGSFPEIIEHGKTGYRCHTLGDFIAAIKEIPKLDRKYIADKAHKDYSLERAALQYDSAFKQLLGLRDEGWYTKQSHYIGD